MIPIIFEDDNFMVLDKPSGIITNSAETTKDQNTLQDWVYKNTKTEISDNFNLRCGVVHRLDKETSGLVLVAKSQKYFEFLQDLFRLRKVQKEYLALAHNIPRLLSGKINEPVGRLPWNRYRFGVFQGGRPALTEYVVQKTYSDGKNNKFSLFLLRPKTGRTHQIRVHLKHLNCPIVSDQRYVGRKTFRSDIKWCSRMFLHASKIAFQNFEFSSKLPLELDKVLLSLKEL